MPSSSSPNQGAPSGGSISQHSGQTSSMLQDYLRAKPTVSERLSGATPSKKTGDVKKGHKNEAKKALKGFEQAWQNAG